MSLTKTSEFPGGGKDKGGKFMSWNKRHSGWSDEARQKSIEVRRAKAARTIAKHGDITALGGALQYGILTSPHYVQAQSYAKKHVPGVTVISTPAQAKKEFGFLTRRLVVNPFLEQAKHGATAGAIPAYKKHFWSKKKDIVLVPKKAEESVLGHELGHIKDFRKRPHGFRDAFFPTTSGRQYAREEAAWKESPSKKGKQDLAPIALESYKRARTTARVSTGIVAGVAAYRYRKPLAKGAKLVARNAIRLASRGKVKI